jgi:hypothetical protein
MKLNESELAKKHYIEAFSNDIRLFTRENNHFFDISVRHLGEKPNF